MLQYFDPIDVCGLVLLLLNLIWCNLEFYWKYIWQFIFAIVKKEKNWWVFLLLICISIWQMNHVSCTCTVCVCGYCVQAKYFCSSKKKKKKLVFLASWSYTIFSALQYYFQGRIFTLIFNINDAFATYFSNGEIRATSLIMYKIIVCPQWYSLVLVKYCGRAWKKGGKKNP